MFLFYSLLLTIAFLLLSPLFLLRRKKYAAGFRQRWGLYPEFDHDGRPVIWLHCVSVGEINAARPLVDEILRSFPNHRLIISTTTQTGQMLARNIFAVKSNAVFYFPFDWRFAVRRALRHFKPAIVLLMETEIWPRFIREAHLSGARVAVVNGRLSSRSVKRYAVAGSFVSRVLADIDLALMQGKNDAEHIISLGLAPSKVIVTGNIKFDLRLEDAEKSVTAEFRQRFGINDCRPLIAAASTHEPEEEWLLKAFLSAEIEPNNAKPRLMVVPRHPERFDSVAKLIESLRTDADLKWPDFKFVRRSAAESDEDGMADVILLDSIGELRAAYPLTEVVFVGGSLIRHGGQSVLEPAAAGKAIVTGPFTHNFSAIITEFLARDAIIQLHAAERDSEIIEQLQDVFTELLEDLPRRAELGKNAAAVIEENRGAVLQTIAGLQSIIATPE